MTDLNAKVVADLKRELAEAKAELAQERERANSGDWVEKAHAETLDAACKELESKLEAARAEIEQQRTRADAAEQELRDYTAHVAQSKNEDRSKLAAIRAHLQGVDVNRSFPAVYRGNDGYVTLGVVEACALIAAAREALEP